MGYLCDKGTIAEWSRWLAYHFDLVGVTGSSPVSATNILNLHDYGNTYAYHQTEVL